MPGPEAVPNKKQRAPRMTSAESPFRVAESITAKFKALSDADQKEVAQLLRVTCKSLFVPATEN